MISKLFDQITYLIGRLIKKARLASVKNSRIHSSSVYESGCQIVGSSFGKHSYCGYDCVILNTNIGSFCSISDDVVIGGSQHPMHYVSTSPVFLAHRDSVKAKFAKHPYVNKPITTIGHDVWIGSGAKIKAGISIGTGAVIGMGSVVTKNVLPYAVVAGNPAKEIKYRFTEQQIDGLLRSKWWEWDDKALVTLGSNCTDVDRFLETQRWK